MILGTLGTSCGLREVALKDSKADRKGMGEIFRAAWAQLKGNRRIWMAYLGTLGDMAIFSTNNTYAPDLYYYQKREKVYAQLSLISLITSYILLALLGYLLSRSNSQNRLDLKLQLAQLVVNIGACLALILGYHYNIYALQDTGLTILLSNQSSIITMTLLFGPLAAAGQSAALLIAVASMINGITTALFNEVGG